MCEGEVAVFLHLAMITSLLVESRVSTYQSFNVGQEKLPWEQGGAH